MLAKGYLKQLTQIEKSYYNQNVFMLLFVMWFRLNNVKTCLFLHQRGVNEPLDALVHTFKLNLL